MEIQHNEQSNLFYLEADGKKVAKMTYVIKKQQMVIEHTTVDNSVRGQNIGIKLVNVGVEFARDNGLKILPECSYAKKILEEGDQYKDVLVTKD